MRPRAVRNEAAAASLDTFFPTRSALDRDRARRRRSHHVAFTYGDVAETAVATVAELRALLWPAR